MDWCEGLLRARSDRRLCIKGGKKFNSNSGICGVSGGYRSIGTQSGV